MKIYFSNVNFSSSTGPNTFGARLANELKNKGHEIVGSNDHYDIYLCFIQPDVQPRKGSKFIHRLDGIWFKPEDFETANLAIKSAYDFADHIIFQSFFDKKMIEKYWGVKKSSVVGNGIDLDYKPASKVGWHIRQQVPKDSKIYVCAASWHNQKRLSENIRLFRKIRQPNDTLVVLGGSQSYVYSQGLDREKREFHLGHLSHDECLSVYDEADYMIHLAWLDHCPNTVVEAASRGCPVICAEAGGTKEIVQYTGGAIISETRDYNFELTDYDNPPPLDMNFDVIEFLERLESLDVEDKSFVDIKRIADQYELIFSNCMEKR